MNHEDRRHLAIELALRLAPVPRKVEELIEDAKKIEEYLESKESLKVGTAIEPQ